MVNVTNWLLRPEFRTVFKIPDKSVLQWFPGHMGKGFKQIHQKLKNVDCVIEVHDARIPISGRNANLNFSVSGFRPHILVLNKMDLTEKKYQSDIERYLQRSGLHNVIFTNCKDSNCAGVKRVIPCALELLSQVNRNNRSEAQDLCIMVVGVPNVGKSSLINALRNRYLKKSSVAHVGAVAGITRSVQSKIKVSQQPLVYILDTPGILTPNVANVEAGLKLAAVSCLQDHLVGSQIIADYILFWLNKHSNFQYVKHYGLKEPTDNILDLLYLIALQSNKMLRVRDYVKGFVDVPNTEHAAQLFLSDFRSGELGQILLDDQCKRGP